jgi:UDP-N-acetylmuramoyl-tripeptide--D-alanyl-D-alanine ligase
MKYTEEDKMKLSDIIRFTNGELIGDADLEQKINNFVSDTRKELKNALYIPLVGENFDAHIFIDEAIKKGAVGAFTHKDMAPIPGSFLIKVKDTLKALQDLAKGYRETIKAPLVAITGSVGKTTTKDMIHSVLAKKYSVLKSEGNFNNFIGLPSTLLKYNNEEIVVVEMGMNHFGEISLLTDIAHPDIAVLTNIGHAHIGILGSRENILKAKMEIVNGMNENGIIVINNDDVLLQGIKDKVKQNIVTYGIKNKSDYMAYDIELTEDSTRFKIKQKDKVYEVNIPLLGEHFVYNALAAWAVGDLQNTEPQDRVEGIEEFKLSKMRMDVIEKNNIKIINDTYNAGPESMKAVLETLSKMQGKRKIAILADMLELGEFSSSIHFDLGCFIGNLELDFLITVGNAAKEIAKGAVDTGMSSDNIFIFEDKQSAIEKTEELIKQGDVVLIKGSRAMEMNKVTEKISQFITTIS